MCIESLGLLNNVIHSKANPKIGLCLNDVSALVVGKMVRNSKRVIGSSTVFNYISNMVSGFFKNPLESAKFAIMRSHFIYKGSVAHVV